MGRKYIDCRECPSDTNCTVALSADTMAFLAAHTGLDAGLGPEPDPDRH